MPHNQLLLLVYSNLQWVGMVKMGLERPPGHLRKGIPLGPCLRPGSQRSILPICVKGCRWTPWAVVDGLSFYMQYLHWYQMEPSPLKYLLFLWLCFRSLQAQWSVPVSNLTLQHPQEVRSPSGAILHSGLLVLAGT